MQFGVLGPVEVRDDDGTAIPLGGGRERLVLAHLLIASDRLLRSEAIIDLLWDDPPPTAKQQVQNVISTLRRRLGTDGRDLITSHRTGYELRLRPPHTLDLLEFRSLVDHAKNDPSATPDQQVEWLGRAVALWRGRPLGDLAGAVVGEGTSGVVRRLDDERIAAVDLYVAALSELGRNDEVLAVTASNLEGDAWNESLHEHRLRALASAGRRTEAATAYRLLRQRFVDELGVPPGPRLAALNSLILRGDSVEPEVTHRLPRELPAPTWTLVGRDALLGAVLARLGGLTQNRPGRSTPASAQAAAPRARTAAPPAVVVLVGVGGVGKTALAVTAGHALSSAYPDGTLYAALGDDPSGAADPHHIVGRFLRALGVESGAIPGSLDERLALFRSCTAGRRVLMVLDGAVAESQVRPLLPTTPGAGAIVTSRSKLAGLVGVRRHIVPPLSVSDGASLIAELASPESDAVHDVELLSQVSSLCGHLPLALCVAGSKLATNSSLTVEELVARLTREHARLDELSAGDIDVRASIAASLADLAAPARALFRRLSLAPAGDWPAWLARFLLHGTTREIEAHRALDELVDRHLVEPVGRDGANQPRYRVHSLVSQLAAERLAAEEPADARSNLTRELATRWLGLARVAGESLQESRGRADAAATGPTAEVDTGPLDGAAEAVATPREWFEAERGSLVSAVVTTSREGDPDLAGALALAVRDFLAMRAYDDDRERVLRVALEAHAERPDVMSAPRQRLELLSSLFAVLAQRQQSDQLPDVAAQALEVARQLDDPQAQQRTLSMSGWAAMMADHFGEAMTSFDAAAALASRLGDEAGRLRAEAQRGVVLRNVGRAAEADPLLAARVEQSRTMEPRRSTSIWLTTRAEGLLDLQRWDEAQSLLAEALDLAQAIQDDLGTAHCRLALARVHCGLGDLDRAEAELAAARAELDPRARSGEDPDVLRLHVDLLAARAEWRQADQQVRRLVALRRRLGQPLELAADLARRVAIAQRCALHPDPERTECERLLQDLGLTDAALRLPTPPYPAHAS
ncbi:BTAD domain-containing putative transcriptional regulator [Terrabacter sp. LjRoot27]|uniref:AfsR/SARP family transcriptional regulator n=1 Tax=Terrabacter sp. LjRoot27 TaxID=3342306 RepID=UPI003ED0EFC2